jgi:hypothetical protein
VMSQKTDGDLIDLIQKRYDPHRVYSDTAVGHFRKLVAHSGLPHFKNSRKSELLEPEDEDVEVEAYTGPEELLDRFKVLVGKRLTNTVKNEMSDIADILLRDGVISKNEHRKMHENYID